MNQGLLHAALTESIIGAFFQVHSELGFGFLESIYADAMAIALTDLGLSIQREVHTPVYFRGRRIGKHRVDLIVERNVVVEHKAGRLLGPEAEPQLLHYLRASETEVGLILNFGPKAEFKRLVYANHRKLIPPGPEQP